MSSVEIYCSVPDSLVDPLEEHFCEWLRSPWSLFQVRDREPFSLHGFFATAEEGYAAWHALRQLFPVLPADPALREVEAADWQNAYKAFLKPWNCEDLHWVPVWEKSQYVVPPGHTALYFDAGMAFGTGSHETTRLCAQRLLDYRRQFGLDDKRVIDAGCGSGILAISAALLGAKDCFGFDRDPEAITVSKENLRTSDVRGSAVHFQEAGLEEGLASAPADLVLANIQSDVLLIYAENFPDALKPNGWLVLSGILTRERDKVREGFTQVQSGRLEWLDSREMGEWCDLLFRARS